MEHDRDDEAAPDASAASDPNPSIDEMDAAAIAANALARAALREYATEFLLLLRTDGRLVATSEASTLGYGALERQGRHIGEHLHPDDLPRVFDLIERARATPGFHERITVRARAKDGTWGWFESEVIDATQDDRLRGAVLRVRQLDRPPIDDAVDRPPDAAVGGDRFLSLAEALPLGILSADKRGCVVYCNSATSQLLNLPAHELLDRGWERAVHPEDRPDVADAAGQVLATGTPHQVTFRVDTGLFVRWAHARFVPLAGGKGTAGWIATIEDVTDRRRAESTLAHQATHDPLTDLPNRTLLEDRLHQACSRLQRDGDAVTVLFIDLDDFKAVNDGHGHAAGDEVLREVARRLRRVVRTMDTVARLGGDEFVVVCEGMDEGTTAVVVERIHDAFDVPMLVGSTSLTVSASVGVARSADPDLDAADLLSRADQEMYRAKSRRRHTG